MDGAHDIHQTLLRAVERELAEFDAIDFAVDAALAQRPRRQAGSSVVYSFRLDPGEVMALERRAANLGLKPSVLARNLVRQGLASARLDDSPDQTRAGLSGAGAT